jgi:hypothetical protein
MVMYIATENGSYQAPSIDDLNGYAIEHNISYPLLADPGGAVCYQGSWNTDNYIPSFHVLTPGPTWHTFDGAVSEGTFIPLLDQY